MLLDQKDVKINQSRQETVLMSTIFKLILFLFQTISFLNAAFTVFFSKHAIMRSQFSSVCIKRAVNKKNVQAFPAK